MNIEKIQRYIVRLQEMLANNKPSSEQEAFKLGNCYVQLGKYSEAQQLYERSCVANFITPMFWKLSGQPNWLADIWVLSGRMDLYKDVCLELEVFDEGPQKGSLVDLYAHGLMELLFPTGVDMSNWIEKILKYPKYKDMFAIGQVLQAILMKDQLSYNAALANLLKAHEGMAKHGSLRETPEGLLCMAAMSLAYAAYRHHLRTEIEHDYFSNGYLEFLIQRST
jgi:tetratricopeptide (TPR) repeat protein